MAYRDEDEDDDWEGDLDADDEPTVPCPYCKEAILEDTPRCPYCERYLSAEDFARGSKPLWVTITALLCLAIAVWLAFVTF